jgi:hypothetical protein
MQNLLQCPLLLMVVFEGSLVLMANRYTRN